MNTVVANPYLAYEYMRIEFDFNNLDEINRFSSMGWQVISVQPNRLTFWALLERILLKNP